MFERGRSKFAAIEAREAESGRTSWAIESYPSSDKEGSL
jgi:hypothetical protein